jgi:hypothetical protein
MGWKERVMISGGETVEEIATGRIGVVSAFGIVGQFPSRLTVQFRDGKMPMVKDSTADELRVVGRPGEQGSPRLIPRDPVI